MNKRLIAIGLAAVALMGVACGGGDDAADEPAQQDAQEEQPESNALDIGMTEYAFGFGADTAEAGSLELNFTNNGEQLHHAIVGKLDEGKTIDDVNKLLKKGLNGPPPPWFDDSPIDLTLVSPGRSAGVVFDADPGTYVLLCFMPDPKGKPHVASGMVAGFDVAEGDAPAPEADATVSISEEGAEVSEIPAGQSTIEVVNVGEIDGEFVVAQFSEGTGPKDVDAWFRSGGKGPAPAEFFGGTHAFPAADSVLVSLNLEPGDYSFITTYGEGKDKKDVKTDFTVQ